MQTETKPGKDQKDRYILRFHDEAERVELKVRAAQNRRSMNAEILHLLSLGRAVADAKAGAA